MTITTPKPLEPRPLTRQQRRQIDRQGAKLVKSVTPRRAGRQPMRANGFHYTCPHCLQPVTVDDACNDAADISHRSCVDRVNAQIVKERWNRRTSKEILCPQ